jgi:hypothetical protein
MFHRYYASFSSDMEGFYGNSGAGGAPEKKASVGFFPTDALRPLFH